MKEVFRPDGERADLGRPYVLTVATLEPRKNLQTLVAAHRLLGDDTLLAVAGGSGWGDQPELRGAERRPARLRLRRGAGAALPRRGRRRLSVPLRGLRDADHRGDGVRRAHGRVGARVDGRGVRRRCGTRRPGRPRGDRRRDPRGASRGGTSSSRPVSSTRGSSPGVRRASRSSPGTRERRRDPGRGRRLPARPDARRDGAARARAARRARRPGGNRGGAALVRRHRARPRRSRGTRGGTTPGCRARRAALDVLHCTTFRGPLRASVPFTVTLHDLALVRHPELFPRWHRLSGRAGIGPRRAGGRPGLRRLRVHEARGGRAARRPRGARGRDRERDRAGLHARRAGRRGRLRARGRRRWSRARTSAGSRTPRRGPASSCASSARAAGAASRRRAGSARSPTTSSPRSTAAPARSSSRRSTRGSAFRSSRRWRPARRW